MKSADLLRTKIPGEDLFGALSSYVTVRRVQVMMMIIT